MATFLDRLTILADGRNFHSWLTVQLGWSRGTVTGVRSGSIPAAAQLVTLAQQENVNLTWLLTGEGAPYVVHFIAEQDAADLARAEHADPDSEACKAARFTGELSVMICRKRQDDGATRYRVFAGAFSYFMPGTELNYLTLLPVNTEEATLLATGWLGPLRFAKFMGRGEGVVRETVWPYIETRKAEEVNALLRLMTAVKALSGNDLELLVRIADRLRQSP